MNDFGPRFGGFFARAEINEVIKSRRSTFASYLLTSFGFDEEQLCYGVVCHLFRILDELNGIGAHKVWCCKGRRGCGWYRHMNPNDTTTSISHRQLSCFVYGRVDEE